MSAAPSSLFGEYVDDLLQLINQVLEAPPPFGLDIEIFLRPPRTKRVSAGLYNKMTHRLSTTICYNTADERTYGLSEDDFDRTLKSFSAFIEGNELAAIRTYEPPLVATRRAASDHDLIGRWICGVNLTIIRQDGDKGQMQSMVFVGVEDAEDLTMLSLVGTRETNFVSAEQRPYLNQYIYEWSELPFEGIRPSKAVL